MSNQVFDDFYLYQIGLNHASERLWAALLKEKPELNGWEAKVEVERLFIEIIQKTKNQYSTRQELAHEVTKLMISMAEKIEDDACITLAMDLPQGLWKRALKP